MTLLSHVAQLDLYALWRLVGLSHSAGEGHISTPSAKDVKMANIPKCPTWISSQ